MLQHAIWVLFLALIYAFPLYAQGVVTLADNIDSANPDQQTSNNILPQNENSASSLLPKITETIGSLAAHNLTSPEQVFCYQVATPPENYRGYTLNGMALVSFCGIVNNKVQQIINQKLLNNPQSILFDQTENCIIRPQIMLRYIRGIDSTDLLISSPCHAIATFYGGTVKAFNAKPAAADIDNIIKPLLANKIDFVSPALFNQSLPIGVAKTEEQKQLLQKKNEPCRQWEQKQQEQSAKTAGWNKLKSN